MTAHEHDVAAILGSSGSGKSTLSQGLPSALVLLALLLLAVSAVHAAYDPEVEAVQQAFTERGYHPGTIDGVMGWRTRGALREFQRSTGIPETGQIDDATRDALGLAPRAGTKRAPEGSADSTGADDTARTEFVIVPGTVAPKAEAAAAEPAAVLEVVAPKAEAVRTEPATVPETVALKAEATRAETASTRAPRPKIDFATLGWNRPQTGAEALARFNAIGAPPEFRRGKGTLFVPKGEFVFVLKTGERFPGLDCDPGAGRLSIEFVFGPDGPVIFTPTEGGEFCQTGIGIAIEVGRTLEIRRVDWGDTQLPPGTVRVTGQGLEYVR